MGSTEMLPSPAHLSKEFAFMTNANDSLLRATTERRGLAVLLCAGGEIDASNVRTWRQIVRAAAHATAAPGPLVVDTSGLDFMAVCAFGVLVEASQQCRPRGIELRLVSSQPITARHHCCPPPGRAAVIPAQVRRATPATAPRPAAPSTKRLTIPRLPSRWAPRAEAISPPQSREAQMPRTATRKPAASPPRHEQFKPIRATPLTPPPRTPHAARRTAHSQLSDSP